MLTCRWSEITWSAAVRAAAFIRTKLCLIVCTVWLRHVFFLSFVGFPKGPAVVVGAFVFIISAAGPDGDLDSVWSRPVVVVVAVGAVFSTWLYCVVLFACIAILAIHSWCNGSFQRDTVNRHCCNYICNTLPHGVKFWVNNNIISTQYFFLTQLFTLATTNKVTNLFSLDMSNTPNPKSPHNTRAAETARMNAQEILKMSTKIEELQKICIKTNQLVAQLQTQISKLTADNKSVPNHL